MDLKQKLFCLIKNIFLATFYLILIEIYSLFLFIFACICTLFVHGTARKGKSPKVHDSTDAETKPCKRILFTTAKMSKTLHLIRHIKWQYPNYKLYCCDAFPLHASRFSKYIEKGFVVPYPSKGNYDEYFQSMMNIINKYDIDLIMPGSSIEEAKFLAKMRDYFLQTNHKCKVFTSSFDKVKVLDDKDKFYGIFTRVVNDTDIENIETFDIYEEIANYYKNYKNTVHLEYFPNDLHKSIKFPFSMKITDKSKFIKFLKHNNLILPENGSDNKDSNVDYKFILKNIYLSTNRNETIFKFPISYSRYKDILMNVNMSEEDTWLLQEYINGYDYTMCIASNNGNLSMNVSSICCEYCVNYYEIDANYNATISKLGQFITNFCKLDNISGIYCFDFRINHGCKDKDKRDNIYIFEANPRPHSCITLINDYGWVKDISMLSGETCNNVNGVTSYGDTRHTFWLFHELLGLLGILNMHPATYEKGLILKNKTKKQESDKSTAWNINELIYFDSNGYLNVNINNVLVGRDAILTIYDPWPVFISHAIHMPYLLINNIANGAKGWSVFDLCILKLTPNKFLA